MPKQSEVNRRGRDVLLGAARKARAGGAKASSSGTRSRGIWAAGPGWLNLLTGAVGGLLLWLALRELGLQALPFLRHEYGFAVALAAGGMLGLTRARAAFWPVAALACTALCVVAYTPVVRPLVLPLVRRDPPARVEAVVVLSSSIQKDGDLENDSQARVLKAYEVLRSGYARRLVLTRLTPPRASYLPAVKKQMGDLGLQYPVEEVGSVFDTHDEARAVSRLARERHWSRVILVSEPTHLRRAGAVFEKAGLAVICWPTDDLEYDLTYLASPAERLKAFRDWVYETVGFQVYRLRGWV